MGLVEVGGVVLQPVLADCLGHLRKSIHRLVPVRVTSRDHVTKLVKSLGHLLCIGAGLGSHGTRLGLGLDDFLFLLCCWGRCGRRSRGSGSLLRVQGADRELLLVLLQNALIVVLPELLAGILSGYSLQDLLTTGVLFLE